MRGGVAASAPRGGPRLGGEGDRIGRLRQPSVQWYEGHT